MTDAENQSLFMDKSAIARADDLLIQAEKFENGEEKCDNLTDLAKACMIVGATLLATLVIPIYLRQIITTDEIELASFIGMILSFIISSICGLLSIRCVRSQKYERINHIEEARKILQPLK